MNTTSTAHRCERGFIPFPLVIVIATTLGVLAAFLIPAVQAARETATRMEASNNLKQIGLAIHNHADATKLEAEAVQRLLVDALRTGNLDREALRRRHARLNELRERQGELLREMRRMRGSIRDPRERGLLEDGIDALAALERHTRTVVIGLQIMF